MVPNAPKWYETQQNMSLGSNGVDRVLSLRKIPMRLRGSNFCTSSARFAQMFVRQPNGPKCTQKVRNAAKREFKIQWGASGAFIAKYSNATSWHELLHQFGPFLTEFQKSTKQSQMHQNCTNASKHEFRVQWGGSLVMVAKNSDATSWHELLHHFGPFCTEFRNSTKRSPMPQNYTKCTKTSVQGPMGWIGCVHCEKFRHDFVAR